MEARVNAVRLLPFEAADGPHNMAGDEALLEAATAGGASLRFYTWSAPTLSLGYFQSQSIRFSDARLTGLPWLRRPTGGGALVHYHELTYALALPSGPPWQTRGESWLARMHAVLADALAEWNVRLESVVEESKYGETLCFLHHTPGDLHIGPAKVVGSARRRQRGRCSSTAPSCWPPARIPRSCPASPNCPASGPTPQPSQPRSPAASFAAPAGTRPPPTGPTNNAVASASWRRRSIPVPSGTPNAKAGQRKVEKDESPAASGERRGAEGWRQSSRSKAVGGAPAAVRRPPGREGAERANRATRRLSVSAVRCCAPPLFRGRRAP